jgi:hypothetical protein
LFTEIAYSLSDPVVFQISGAKIIIAVQRDPEGAVIFLFKTAKITLKLSQP